MGNFKTWRKNNDDTKVYNIMLISLIEIICSKIPGIKATGLTFKEDPMTMSKSAWKRG